MSVDQRFLRFSSLIGEESFENLKNTINAELTLINPDASINMEFKGGRLEIYSDTPGVELGLGMHNDTSNFASIINMNNVSPNKLRGSKDLYKVINSSKITDSNLFVRGDIYENRYKQQNL